MGWRHMGMKMDGKGMVREGTNKEIESKAGKQGWRQGGKRDQK